SQNYPNPFNPATEIKFTLTKSGFVTLKVYSTLGQEVATLVNEELGVGGYTSHFDASKLSSGTYIYRLTANGQSISKKMMVVK
ncbi:MAG: T9SS type A sorting domain-containing protein, partial [Ignavibacteriae bacterium]|nr:T9SS type A sorting domain-containing protein [Ignavibacteriota bacterium]